MAAVNFSPLKESLGIRSLLSNMSASTLEMLNDRSITSFEFAFEEAVVNFSRGRSAEDALMLTAAALLSPDLRFFWQHGIAVSLVLLQATLQALPVGNPAAFFEGYVSELRKVDARLLLYNIEKMVASTRLS
jgi:hypothetical protein